MNPTALTSLPFYLLITVFKQLSLQEQVAYSRVSFVFSELWTNIFETTWRKKTIITLPLEINYDLWIKYVNLMPNLEYITCSDAKHLVNFVQKMIMKETLHLVDNDWEKKRRSNRILLKKGPSQYLKQIQKEYPEDMTWFVYSQHLSLLTSDDSAYRHKRALHWLSYRHFAVSGNYGNACLRRSIVPWVDMKNTFLRFNIGEYRRRKEVMYQKLYSNKFIQS